MSLAITSAGWVAPGRSSWDHFLGASDAHPYAAGEWFDAVAHLGKHGHKYLSNATRYLLAATGKAVGATDRRTEALKGRTGIVVGTNQADYWVRRDIDVIVREQGAHALNAIEAPNTAVNLPASHVAMRYGYTGPNVTLTNHHLAGMETFYVADRLMRRHRLATMMCGSVEDSRGGVAAPALGGATVLMLEDSDHVETPVLAWIESIRLDFFPGPSGVLNARTLDDLRRRCADAPALWLMSHCRMTADRIRHVLAPTLGAPVNDMTAMNDSFSARHTLLPLLQLLWLVANKHEGQVLAVSPLGHVVMFTLKKRRKMMSTILTEKDERLVEIKMLVCDILELEQEEVTETSLFKEEHGADSLRAIEILATLEKQFNIKIPQAEMAKMVNLAGVYAVVSNAAGWDE